MELEASNLGPEVGGKMVVVWANDLTQDCFGKECLLPFFWGMGRDAIVANRTSC